MAEQIEAAGVVLVRQGDDGPEVAVVHRPHRSDWSLPKGKLDPGERHEVAAVRETLEETGVSCLLGPSLGHRRYPVNGVPKRVRYWRATVLDAGHHEPDDEIDEIRWLRRKAAKALLSYDEDQALVDAALTLPDTTPTVVLRHAEATKRAAWRESGDPMADLDAQRPLNADGIHQAHTLVEVLDVWRPDVVVSSDARRCRATVEPYVAHRDLALQLEHALSEEGCADDPRETAAAVARLLELRVPALWCTHRPVLPIIVSAIATALGVELRGGNHANAKLADGLDPRLKPGAAIVLHRDADGVLAAVDRLDE